MFILMVKISHDLFTRKGLNLERKGKRIRKMERERKTEERERERQERGGRERRRERGILSHLVYSNFGYR